MERMMIRCFRSFRVSALLATGYLFAATLPSQAEAPLVKGDSTVTRSHVNVGLHIPASLTEVHGPSGILIYFGGSQDSVSYYQQSLSPVAEALDLIIMVPQMPWFKDPGMVKKEDIYPVMARLVDEARKQFQMTAPWLIVGGVSAGGAPAYELAKQWGSKIDLLLLSSTGPFPDIGNCRTLHVVAETERERLGPQGRRGPVLGHSRKDMFAIPGGQHSAQLEYICPWVATEVSALRLAEASKTLRLAEEKIAKRDMDGAKALLKSTFGAVVILGQPVPGGNAFFEYETKRRPDLLKLFAPAIKSLEDTQAKMSVLARQIFSRVCIQRPVSTSAGSDRNEKREYF